MLIPLADRSYPIFDSASTYEHGKPFLQDTVLVFLSKICIHLQSTRSQQPSTLGAPVKPIQHERKERRGLSSIEYGLLASLIAVGTIVALSTMSNQISNQFNAIGSLIGSQKAPVQGNKGGSSFN